MLVRPGVAGILRRRLIPARRLTCLENLFVPGNSGKIAYEETAPEFILASADATIVTDFVNLMRDLWTKSKTITF